MGETITWRIETHEHKERSTDWYWGVGLLAVIGIGVSIYFMNILLAIILAMGVVSLFILAARGPREHDVTLSPRGVDIDGTLYRYPTIHSFWVSIEDPEIEEIEPRVRLFLTTAGYINPRIMVPLDDVDHAELVRDYLLNHLEEVEQEPHFAEHIAELLGV